MRLDEKEIDNITRGARAQKSGPGGIFARFPAPLFLLGGAVFFLGTGLAIIKKGGADRINIGGEGSGEVVFESGGRGKDDNGNIFVDVGGAVRKPGVYKLGAGARVKDALVAAGGLSAGADREFVGRSVNLAAPLSDGTKVYIPDIREQGGNTLEAKSSALININAAGKEELESLKGIGKVRAEKIIGGRPYQKIEDLAEKGVLSKGALEKIKDRISVY